MEQNSNTTSDSDPSMQTCNKCGLEKPIEDFVARDKTKRPTKWCLACRIYGRAGHNRWAAKKKRMAEGLTTPPSQEKVNPAPLMGSPEGTQSSILSQIPYPLCPRPPFAPYIAPAPGAYGHYQPSGGFQIATPPLNPPSMYSIMWGYDPPIPTMRSLQWISPNDFSPHVHERNQPSDQASEAEDSNHGSSENEALSDVALDDRVCYNDTSQYGLKGLPKIDDEPLSEQLESEKGQDVSDEPESPTLPYFTCVACCIARPTRLEDSGVCVYCFEHPTQYCVKGGHEDDKISFVDSDGRWHEVCNRCQSNPDPT